MIIPMSNSFESFSAQQLKEFIRHAENDKNRTFNGSGKLEALKILATKFDASGRKVPTSLFRHFSFSFIIGVHPDKTYILLSLMTHPVFTIISDVTEADFILVTMPLDGWISFVLARGLDDWSLDLAKQLRSYFDRSGLSSLFES